MEAAAAAAAAAGFAQQAVRQAFTRKVLLLVLLQVAFTTGIACVFMFVKPVKVRAPCWAVCVCLIQLAARAAGGADDMDLFVNAVKVRERLAGLPVCRVACLGAFAAGGLLMLCAMMGAACQRGRTFMLWTARLCPGQV